MGIYTTLMELATVDLGHLNKSRLAVRVDYGYLHAYLEKLELRLCG